MKYKTLQIFNTVSFAAMVCINALANLIPIGIGNTGAVSGKYPTLFTPAPYTFAIWGAIYFLLIFFILFQWGVFSTREETEELLHEVGPAFAISCLFNIAWIFTWHYDVIVLSMFAIIGLLISLISVSRRLGNVELRGIQIVTRAVFDIYIGWIAVAAMANISVFLVSISWTGLGLSDVFWTCTLLTVGALIGAAFSYLKGSYLSTLAVMWAYVGILVRHMGTAGYAGDFPVIIGFAIGGLLLMLFTCVFSIVRNLRHAYDADAQICEAYPCSAENRKDAV